MVARRVIVLRRALGPAILLAGVALLSACGGDAPEPDTQQTEIPEELQAEPEPQIGNPEAIGTPMEERLATIGLVNKRNNETRDIEMYPGETRRFDDVIVRLAACERTAPWEAPEMTGAFVQVFVNERQEAGEDTQWNRIFSGWLFKESPSLNVVEHPVYDVWVKDCAMSFPGEEEAVAAS
ncbi:DUF2155 domain-containing protein [Aurantiacibacter sediminis]|uniref:DUF2155 domain-containing protein n=1 Tax=Aurantiacibacter sediminis TaxID=2793064 RepID=A0ABS0N1A3_9SPHN|nr:DUF2155 domain-containing protein [Aurantiacibacter sediminis]MBH5321736.1 DUF2155 domain-containing protein [Aurantiacibacter sediminis]